MKWLRDRWLAHRRPTAVLACLTIVASATLVSTARGDGDPASDYLIGEQVFLPYASSVASQVQNRLAGTVAAANQRGFGIRVALIPTSLDLGSITELWKQPRTYARFLDVELSFVYKGRLLIVMPNGFGFAWLHHPTSSEYRLLAMVQIAAGPSGMMAAAQAAVQRLAAASDITLHATASTGDTSQNQVDPILIAAIAVTVGLLTMGARLLTQRRGRLT